jgi:hypothetical protein
MLTPDQKKDIKSVKFEREFYLEPLDERVKGLVEYIDIKGKKILDIGSLDGYHASQLSAYGAEVTCSDIRPINLCKSLYRNLYHGIHSTKYMLLDAEEIHEKIKKDEFDILFMSGVFYHLKNPMDVLKNISPLFEYILLEGHVAEIDKHTPIVDHKGYRGFWYNEQGWQDTCSGKDEKSFWLTQASLADLITECDLYIDKVIYNDNGNAIGQRICYLLRRL